MDKKDNPGVDEKNNAAAPAAAASHVIVNGKTVTQVKTERTLINKKVFFIILAAILVIAAGVFIYTVLHKSKNSNSGAGGTAQTTVNEAAKLQKDLDNAATPDNKAKAYDNFSSYELGNGNNAKAVTYAQSAIEQKKTAETYAQLGAAAEAAGNYKLAAEAYTQAAELSPNKNPGDEYSDYTIFTSKAKDMQAKL